MVDYRVSCITFYLAAFLIVIVWILCLSFHQLENETTHTHKPPDATPFQRPNIVICSPWRHMLSLDLVTHIFLSVSIPKNPPVLWSVSDLLGSKRRAQKRFYPTIKIRTMGARWLQIMGLLLGNWIIPILISWLHRYVYMQSELLCLHA